MVVFKGAMHMEGRKEKDPGWSWRQVDDILPGHLRASRIRISLPLSLAFPDTDN